MRLASAVILLKSALATLTKALLQGRESAKYSFLFQQQLKRKNAT